MPRIRCTPAPPLPRRTKRSGSTPARRCSCARPAKPPDRLRWRARSTKRHGPAGWTRSPSASRTTPKSSRSPASRSPRKRCAQCYAQGAERFGWATRPLKPRQMRDEAGLLVGWGMGTATFPALMFAAEARATLRGDGSGVMEIGAHDMGQGAWTALAQIAADGLGTRRRSDGVQVGHIRPAGRGHRRRLGPHRHRGHGDPQCGRGGHRQARRPRHRRRALAVVRRGQCRRDRARRPPVPSRRRKSQRELWRYSRARRPCADRGQRQGRRRPRGAIDLRHACPRRGFRRGQGRSRSRPDPRHPHGRRFRRGTGHQSPHGAAARSSAA